QLDAAVLDAAVGGVQLELHFQLEVLRLPTAPDHEGIGIDLLLRRALADNRAVLDTPELRIAVPPLQALAVEDLLKAGVILERQWLDARPALSSTALRWRCPTCRRLRRCLGHDAGDREESHCTGSQHARRLPTHTYGPVPNAHRLLLSEMVRKRGR